MFPHCISSLTCENDFIGKTHGFDIFSEAGRMKVYPARPAFVVRRAEFFVRYVLYPFF